MTKRFSRINKFRQFINTHFDLTQFYASHIKMELCPPQCDKYICGSDQIWNPVLTAGVSPNYFLNFVKNPLDKIAYAPSFGTDGVTPIFQNKIRKYLRNFGYLSVREKSGQKMISELTGGRSAQQLIDPVFLLKKDEWEKMGKPNMVTGKYILLYIMQHDNEVFQYARQLKESLGLPVVEISRYGYHPDFIDLTLVDVGPDEFLGLFRDASYVCTNSYHGLVYSLIFEKEFSLISCKRFRARIDSLLELLGIQIDNINDPDWDVLSPVYNREKTRNVIELEREKALRYLDISLSGGDIL